jgi:hypothetical protein
MDYSPAMQKLSLSWCFIAPTALMGLGWMCMLAQGDAPPQDPRIASIVVIFGIAAALLAIPVILLRRAKRWAQIALFPLIGLQAAFCVYVIVREFEL